MRIRVLHVIDHLGYGGAPLLLKSIVEQLDTEQFNPIVCALRPNPRPITLDVETITLDIPRYSPRSLRALHQICLDRGIDVIHAHLNKSIITSLFMRNVVPVIIHEHGAILRKNLSGWLFRWLLRHKSSRIAMAIGISKATAEALLNVTTLAGNRVTKISNFVDTRRFTPTLYHREQVRAKYGITTDELVIGFVGRLHRYKGADVLVDAMACLRDDQVSCRALIVGEGAEREALQMQIRQLGLEERVQMIGLVENPAELMLAFDIGVVPSRLEGFGLVAAEMMAMKVPVVASDVGGLPELIEDGSTGLLVRTDQAAELARVMKKALDDSILRERLCGAAYKRISQYNGFEQVQRIEQLYRRCATEQIESV